MLLDPKAATPLFLGVFSSPRDFFCTGQLPAAGTSQHAPRSFSSSTISNPSLQKRKTNLHRISQTHHCLRIAAAVFEATAARISVTQYPQIRACARQQHAHGATSMRYYHSRVFSACIIYLCVALVDLRPFAEAIPDQSCSVDPTHCFTSHSTPSVRIFHVQHPAAAGRICEDDLRDLLNLPLRVTKQNTLHWTQHERCR